ncbi:MAG: A/G-specific adenine glycosylase [Acidimicrobiia bacterium]|nr:A/G-specific adenine glycosylase [Acidimicrobiia bacterium]
MPPPGLTGFRRAVLDWAPAHHRDLPWRCTRDPWAVLVSELMLQQTQVDRVIPRYHDFLARFPTPAICADAAVSEVVRAWEGLGYNRRAVNLHRAATVVAVEHGGDVPLELDALLALPGVGPYTARAVQAFAAERDVGVLDTNVARVLARTEGRSLHAARRGAGPRRRARPGRVGPGRGTRRCSTSERRCAGPVRRPVAPVPSVAGAGGQRAGRRIPTPPGGSRRGERSTSRPSRARTARGGAGWSTRCVRGPVSVGDVPEAPRGGRRTSGGPDRVAATLVADGLAVERDGQARSTSPTDRTLDLCRSRSRPKVQRRFR